MVPNHQPDSLLIKMIMIMRIQPRCQRPPLWASSGFPPSTHTRQVRPGTEFFTWTSEQSPYFFCGGKEDDGKTCHKMMESDGTWWKIMKHDIKIEYDEQIMDTWFNMIEKKRWIILNQDGGTSPYALWCSYIHLHDWFLRYMLVNMPYSAWDGESSFQTGMEKDGKKRNQTSEKYPLVN